MCFRLPLAQSLGEAGGAEGALWGPVPGRGVRAGSRLLNGLRPLAKQQVLRWRVELILFLHPSAA